MLNCLIVALIKISRNTAFETLGKVEIGNNSYRICKIMKSHQLAKKLSPDSVKPLNNNKRKVISKICQTHIIYVIEKLLENCDCKIMYCDCQVSPHAYTWTCLDATLYATICKHIFSTHGNQWQCCL